MTVTTKQQIVRELARLRIWRDVAAADESARDLDVETDAAHQRINNLLDQLDSERVYAQHN
jgi:hypothetical protein